MCQNLINSLAKVTFRIQRYSYWFKTVRNLVILGNGKNLPLVHFMLDLKCQPAFLFASITFVPIFKLVPTHS